MKKLHLLFAIVFYCSWLSSAEENKIIQKTSQSVLSFLLQDKSTKRRLYNTVEKPLLQNMQAVLISRSHVKIASEQEYNDVYAATARLELTAKIGLLDDAKTLQDNLHDAMDKDDIERVLSCVAKEKYLRNFQQNFNRSLISKKQSEKEDLLEKALLSFISKSITNKLALEKEETFKRLLFVVGRSALSKGDKSGWTPLHYAVGENQNVMVQYIITLGVSLNKGDLFGWTPLHYAAINESSKMAQLLVDAGVNLNQVNQRGDTPFENAVAFKKEKPARLLMKASMPMNQLDNQASEYLDFEKHRSKNKIAAKARAARRRKASSNCLVS